MRSSLQRAVLFLSASPVGREAGFQTRLTVRGTCPRPGLFVSLLSMELIALKLTTRRTAASECDSAKSRKCEKA